MQTILSTIITTLFETVQTLLNNQLVAGDFLSFFIVLGLIGMLANSVTENGLQSLLRIKLGAGVTKKTALPPLFLTAVSTSTQQTYYSIVLYLCIAAAICIVLAAIAYMFSMSSAQESEKRSEYECGFEPFDSATRLPFDVHFYLVGILFLIFDVEIALLFPWVLGVRNLGWPGFYSMLGFLLVLGFGFIYEWCRGALIWPSQQRQINYASKLALFFLPASSLNSMPTIAEHPLSELVKLSQGAHITAFVPEIFLTTAIVGVLLYLAVSLNKPHSKKQLAFRSLKLFLISFVITGLFYAYVLYVGKSGFSANGYVLTTLCITFIKLLVLLTGGVILNSSRRYIVTHQRHLLEYPITLALALLFTLLLISSGHLIAAFLAIVGFSLNLYVLVLFDAPLAIAREAGIKYFYLSTISSGLMIYGIFLIFVTTGACNLMELGTVIWADTDKIVAAAGLLQPALAILFTGFFFKLSAVPGHLWAPEVYEGAPDPITTFFMLPVKIGMLGFIINFLTLAVAPLSIFWQPMLAVSAVLSLIWGCLGAVGESKTKRFLAYTAINQMGFLLVGLATNTFEGYQSTLLYLTLYVATNIGFLLVFLHTGYTGGKTFTYLTDFRNMGHRTPGYSLVVASFLLSMAGIPPLAGFFGKYYLLLHAQQQELYSLVIVGLATSLISTYYYLRLIKIMFFEGSRSSKNSHFFLWTSSNARVLGLVVVLLWGFTLFSSAATSTFATLTASIYDIFA